jgi:putative transcriptional regulator
LIYPNPCIQLSTVKDRQGQLLIASSRLMDPNFARSIVLIVREDEDSVIGLVLNRPLEISVEQAVGEEIDAADGVHQFIHQGGPCPGPLMVLYTSSGHEDSDGEAVMPGVRFTAQRDEIENLMRRSPSSIKYFANYSGWGPGQLDSEIEEGSWVLTKATPEEIFGDDEEQWEKIRMRVMMGIDPQRMPQDPSAN